MMKKIIQICGFLFLIVTITALSTHKFYIAIHKIEFNQKAKRVEITSRIFIDDINLALEKKYHTKTFIASGKETINDEELLKKYLAEKFTLKINGQPKPINFLSKEIEDNVIVCYMNVKNISKVTSIEVENSIITELHEEQQNIVQANFNAKKSNLLLTSQNTKGMLK